MLKLAGSISNPVLAELLDLGANTAVRWAALAACDWSDYVANHRSGEAAAPRAAPGAAMSRTARLTAVLAANLALVGALVAVGVTAHSLGVLAEGADYLGDAAGIGVALLAIHLASQPPTPTHPHGHPRATRYAAAINASWLLALSVLVAAGAVGRLVSGVRQVHGLPVLIISGVAGVLMLTGTALLGGDIDRDGSHDDLNIRAVLLDTAADAAAATSVAITGAIIYATHRLDWLDPTVALIIALVVGYHAARLLIRVRRALRP